MRHSVSMGVTLLSMVLSGCQMSPTIKDPLLADRVVACSAGFSDELAASLGAEYEKSKLQGEMSATFKDRARAVIFSRLPPQDRLKGYEDYIRCIESPFH